MTQHFHVTPITPNRVLQGMGGRSFMVSHAAPQQIEMVHRIGQSVRLDNGAFSKWKRGRETDWPAFYAWAEPWLHYPTTDAIIPDVIDGGSQLQDALLREWPFGHKGLPVWHMDEPIQRLLKLCDEWPKVAIGSTGEFRTVLSRPWEDLMDDVFEELSRRHRFMPYLHMLRGMQCSGKRWPFAALDSSDVAQNHNRGQRKGGPLVDNFPIEHADQNFADRKAERWDAQQCAGRFVRPPRQAEMILPLEAL